MKYKDSHKESWPNIITAEDLRLAIMSGKDISLYDGIAWPMYTDLEDIKSVMVLASLNPAPKEEE